MIRIAVSVEGFSEKEFCGIVLKHYFFEKGIDIIPIIISTKREKCGKKYRGGCINFDIIKNEVQKLIHSFDYVTTLYDFYGFKDNHYKDANELEESLSKFCNFENFIPYIQQYEFEALLFAEPQYFKIFNIDFANEMKSIINQFESIEHINNSIQTAPSKRIEKLFLDYTNEKYDKVFHAPAILQNFGIENIRTKAKRFNEWLEKIEMLIED